MPEWVAFSCLTLENSCSSRKQSGLALVFEPEALAVDANNDRVVQDAIEHRRGEHGVIGKGVISAAEGEIRVFFTGMRPSELVAVRVGSVNLHARTLQVERSRHLGSEAAPKTQRARRTVRLTRGNVEVLEPLFALKAKPHDYLFKNVWGQPIEPANFYDLFRDAQRALKISPLRDLYSAKDTYISLALTNDVSLTWLSEQTGVAVATLLKHYGRFIHTSQADDLDIQN